MQVRNHGGLVPLGCALSKAAWVAERRWPGWQEQLGGYMRCAGALLEGCPTQLALDTLCQAGPVALPLFAELAAARPLSAEQWAQVPRGCPGLGALLPAVLAREGGREAPCLVRRLFRRDRRRLWELLRCLGRLQRQQPALPLPLHIVHRMLGGV